MTKTIVPAYTAKQMTQEQFYHAYTYLAEREEEHILLESGRDGQYSIAGVSPLATLQATTENQLTITWRHGEEEYITGDPLQSLTTFVEQYGVSAHPALPFYQGGVLGFISYDYVRYYETLPNDTKTVTDTPDVHFYLFDEWAVYDIANEQAYFMTLHEEQDMAEAVAQKWLHAAEKAQQVQFTENVLEVEEEELEVSVTGPQFEQMVRDVQSYIANGDVTQVNLSVRQSKKITVSPLTLYGALRKVNPSPYMASIGAKTFDVASSSPELLIKKRGRQIETRPIGGTRKRGTTEVEDLANEQELLRDEKEREEHLMLVALEKDDFSKVCIDGSVEANELLVIERYSHVMHLVSNIRGTVREDASNADIVKAVFPGGTITGAPKVRTMEIIEQLEPEKRGLYTGSIGWLGFNGDMELNVVIRTAFIQQEQIHIQAGAGLVAASIPHAEYVESLAKGRALWTAKHIAEQSQDV